MSKDTKSASTSNQKQFQTVKRWFLFKFTTTFLTFFRFADARDLVGFSEQILCKGIPVPQINCEIAVPLEKFREATEALHSWNAKYPGRLHYPFIYRAVGKSDAWLNAPSRGPMVWIGFLVYVAEDGTVRSDGMETMREVQKTLAEYGGLPHWGKHFVPSIYDFETIPGWKAFMELRSRVDPSNKFLSKFMAEKVLAGNQKTIPAGARLGLTSKLWRRSIYNEIIIRNRIYTWWERARSYHEDNKYTRGIILNTNIKLHLFSSIILVMSGGSISTRHLS